MMEKTYQEALLGARIVDLQDNSELSLPDSKELVTLGLTVDDRLSFTIDSFYDDEDDVVLTLCYVQREENGHWLIPSAFIPCVVNEVNVEWKSLLSHGSTIKVGDREMRYSLPIESRLPLNGPSPGKAPPKPQRSLINIEEPVDQSHQMMTIMEDEDEDDPDGKPDVVICEPEADEELIQHLATSEEVAQLACSYVSHQVALYTDLVLSTEELDFMFRSIQSCSESNISQMHKFVKMYNKEQAKAELEVWPLHGPVIYLLTQLLNSTLDSEDLAALWIKLLATFANFSPNLPSFIQHKVAPIVMAAMAVHTLVTPLQQYAATVLSQLATFTPPIGQKGPVREAGVDLVINALKLHVHETLILRPALRTLANLTQTYSNVADEALSIGSLQISHEGIELSSTVVLQEVERSMGILDFIEEHALPVVMETMENNLKDVSIQTEGRRILAFFVDDGINVSRKNSVSIMSTRKVRFQLDSNDPNSIVSTDSVLMDNSPTDIEEFPQIKTLEGRGEHEERSDWDDATYQFPELDITQKIANDERADLLLEAKSLTVSPGLSDIPQEDPASKGETIGIDLNVEDIELENELTEVDVDVDLDMEFPSEVEETYKAQPELSKSLMDELAEIASSISADDLFEDYLGENLENNVLIVDNQDRLPDIPQHDPHRLSTWHGAGDAANVDEGKEGNEDSKILEKVQKRNSAKAGTKMLMTNKTMDKTLKSGKNKVLNKLKKRLRFWDLRKKEDQMVTEHMASSDGSESPITDSEVGQDYQNQTDEIMNSLVLAGVTISESSTDNTGLSSHLKLQKVQSDARVPNGTAETLAPPLFLPTVYPNISGSQNTVNNLIELWKHKLSIPTKEETLPEVVELQPLPKRKRKQWRPFENDEDEQLGNALSNDAIKEVNQTRTDSMNRTEKGERSSSENDEASEMLTEKEAPMQKILKRGSLATIPEVGRSLMTSSRPSLTDSMEVATWASSYMSVSGQDIDDLDPELEQEVRLNKIRWKSVVAEVKDRVKSNTMPVKLNSIYLPDKTGYDEEKPILILSKDISNNPSRNYKPRPDIGKTITTFPTTDLNKECYHEANILAAKYLMVQAVLKTWHLSPSLAAGLLETPSGELLISVGASPSLISDIRPALPLDKSMSELFQITATMLMGILTSIPSANEIRLELLDEVRKLMHPDKHLYHIQVGIECALCLLNHEVHDLKTVSNGQYRSTLDDLKESITLLTTDDRLPIKESFIKLRDIISFLVG